jgi:adenylosuccinate synthase
MKVFRVVDLGFGDAGKGTTIDFLSRLSPNTLIVRFNGGPQAAHNVVTAEGLHHTFAQFGSGTLVPSVKTYLSKYMWIDPLSLLNENEALKKKGITDALSRLYIDENTRIVTPFHKSASRMKEARLKHGSCGMGMGEAVSDSIGGLSLKVGDIKSNKAIDILNNIRSTKVKDTVMVGGLLEEARVLCDDKAPLLSYDIYRYLFNKVNVVREQDMVKEFPKFEQVIFEGAGGILLDENYGFHPHTMWSNNTTENAKTLWSEAMTLGIIRTYSTRHGAGPLVTEGKVVFVDKYNVPNEWQGSFRTGAFDLVATKYAVKANGGVDALVVTHTDEVCSMFCDSYTDIDSEFYDGDLILPERGDLERQSRLTEALFNCKPHIIEIKKPFVEEISDRLNLPVFLESYGERSCDKRLLCT